LPGLGILIHRFGFSVKKDRKGVKSWWEVAEASGGNRR